MQSSDKRVNCKHRVSYATGRPMCIICVVRRAGQNVAVCIGVHSSLEQRLDRVDGKIVFRVEVIQED